MRSSRRGNRSTVRQAGTAFLVAACLFASEARAENWVRDVYGDDAWFGARANANLFVGARLLDSKDWKPVETLPEVGIDVDYDGGRWPVALCGALLASASTDSTAGVEVTARIVELQLGVRKVWGPILRLRPYVGGGGSVLWLSYEVDGGPTAHESDLKYGAGWWAGAGASMRLGRSWQVGADARWSQVSVELGGSRANAGGLQLGVTAGYHWAE